MASQRKRYLTAADGSIVYVTIDGDMVDQIARTYYGAHRENTERVYDVNPGLADLDMILPAGLVIKLPVVDTTPQATPFRRLWD